MAESSQDSIPRETLSTPVVAPPPPEERITNLTGSNNTSHLPPSQDGGATNAHSNGESARPSNVVTNSDDATVKRTEPVDLTRPTIDPSTLAIHADDSLCAVTDIAPPIHMSTTFHYAEDPEKLVPVRDLKELVFLPCPFFPLLPSHLNPFFQLSFSAPSEPLPTLQIYIY